MQNLCSELYSANLYQKLVFLYCQTNIYHRIVFYMECYFLLPLFYKFFWIYLFIYTFSFILLGFTLYKFLKHFLKNDQKFIPFIVFFFPFLPSTFPDAYLKVNLSAILGTLFFFLCGYLFVSSRKFPLIFYIFTPFFSVFTTEVSRLYTFPFLLLLLFTFKDFRKEKVYLVISSGVYTLFNVFIFKPSLPSPNFYTLLNSIERLIETHIFTFGFIPTILLAGYFLLYGNTHRYFYIFSIFALLTSLFHFPLPHYGMATTFTILGTQWWFLVIFFFHTFSMFLLFKKSSEAEEKLISLSIILLPLLYSLALLMIPSDFPLFSPRHLICVYPFFLPLLFRILYFIFKKGKIIFTLFLLFIIFHIFSIFYNYSNKIFAFERMLNLTKIQFIKLNKLASKAETRISIFHPPSPDFIFGDLNFLLHSYYHPYLKLKSIDYEKLYTLTKGRDIMKELPQGQKFFLIFEDLFVEPELWNEKFINEVLIKTLSRETDFFEWWIVISCFKGKNTEKFFPFLKKELYFQTSVEYKYIPIFENELLYNLIILKKFVFKKVFIIKIFRIE